MALTLGGLESRDALDERSQLALAEGCRVERLEVMARVLEIALDAHRSEQQPPDPKLRRRCR